MPKKEVIFEELGREEKTLLLRAFDYDVDPKGNILDSSGSKIPSEERPSEFINIESAALVPGSLRVMDGTPTAISKYIREELEE